MPSPDRPVLVEAAVETVDAAIAAEQAGAARIELCGRLDIGGTTPLLSVMEAVLNNVCVPVTVMVRPRGGEFCYTEDEISLMKKDIALIRAMQPAGIVLGVVGKNGQMHTTHLLSLLHAVGEIPVTFHRAFDSFLHPHAALEDLVDFGVARLLTSGGGLSATAGAGNIGALVRQARDRIIVVAAGGVRAHNVRELVQHTGVREVHARYENDAQLRGLVEAVR